MTTSLHPWRWAATAVAAIVALVGTLAAAPDPALDGGADLFVPLGDGPALAAFETAGGLPAGEVALAGGSGSSPWAAAIGPGGSLYVADVGVGTVARYDPDGLTPLDVALTADLVAAAAPAADGLLEAAGADPGRFAPRGMAFGPSGELFVVDAGRNRIVRYRPADRRIGELPVEGGGADGAGVLVDPLDVVVDDDGTLLVSDRGDDVIHRFDPATGSHLGPAATFQPGAAPAGMTRSPDGDLLVALSGSGEVVALDPSSGQVGDPLIEGLAQPIGVAVDADEALWVADAWTGAVTAHDATTGWSLDRSLDLGARGGPRLLTARPDRPDRPDDGTPGPGSRSRPGDRTKQWLESLPERGEGVDFVETDGTADEDVDFAARADDYDAVLADGDVALVAEGSEVTDAVVMEVVGGAEEPEKEMLDESTDRAVEFGDVLPGVDVVYSADGDDLEYSFVVAPGSDPDEITLDFDGAVGLSVDDGGDLVIESGSGPDYVSTAPYTYQELGDRLVEVDSSYVIRPDGTVGFELGWYVPSRPVIIDPTFRAVDGEGGSVPDGGTLDLDVPVDHQAGDLLIAQVAYNASGAGIITPPGGWTTIDVVSHPSADLTQGLYWREATGSEPASYSWTLDGGATNTATGAIAAYADVDTTSPIDDYGSQTQTGTSIVAPSIDTTVPGTTLVGFFAYRGDGSISPSGMNERWDLVSGTTLGAEETVAGAADEIQPSTGSTGSRSAAAAESTDGSIGHLVALTPSSNTLVVNSTADAVDASAGDGTCETSTPGECTLRAAVQESNALAGTQVIVVPAGTYTLSLTGINEDAAATGDLDLTADVTITGAGAGETIIDGNASDRIFESWGTSVVEITEMTVDNGHSFGIASAINVTGNSTLTLGSSIVSNGNQTPALHNDGVFVVEDSRITGNDSSADGGGLLANGPVTITGSTFDANTSAGNGGGLHLALAWGSADLTNVTVSGNSASFDGGGIYNNSTADLVNVTVTGNDADNGGGIVEGASVTTNLTNTIVAGNTAITSNPDAQGTFESQGFNIVGSVGTSSGWVGSDQLNTDPLIDALADNGGETPTHALQSASPAIDAGTATGAPDTDQRGLDRPQDGDGDTTATDDIGAYEHAEAAPAGPCTDSDSDGLCDDQEDANTDADDDPSTNPGPDTDGDTTPNYLDADDDGDGTATSAEGADPNGDGDPRDAIDTDHDGQPDYLDAPTSATSATVAAEQKISDTQGGLVATLADDDYFGRSVASVGDLDGDGVVDLAVGVELDDDGGLDRGAVYVLFLNADGTVKAEQKISATAGGFGGVLDGSDYFGISVDGIGDLDGDGIGDLAVGARNDDDGAGDAGAVWVLFLNADGTVKAEQKISATAGGFGGSLGSDDKFGVGLSALGDLDGDGNGDLAVGAYHDDDGAVDAGAVWVLFLNGDGTVKAEQKISATAGGFGGSLDASDYFGNSVAGIGDLDGDGAGDLVVGAWSDDDGGTDRGASYVLLLGTDGTVTSTSKISSTAGGLTGPLDDTDRFGTDVAGLGDLDADGTIDLAVGAFLDDDGGADRGAVYVLDFASDVADTAEINSSGDAGDASAGDGLCNTGGTNSEGAPECTLRAAIEEVNAAAGVNTIHFDIPTSDAGHSGGVWTIQPSSAVLPTVTQTVTLDATTQPGWSDDPVVGLDGTLRSAGDDGLVVSAASSSVSGLSITNWPDEGAYVLAADVTVTASFFGVTPAGATAANAGSELVVGTGASGVVIGGATAADGNVFAAAGVDGLYLVDTATDTTIANNLFGLGADGVTDLGAFDEGIKLDSGVSGVTIDSNRFGHLPNMAIRQDGATGVVVTGNVFGIDTNGDPAPVDQAIVATAGTVTFGGTVAGDGNTVANTVFDAVALSSGSTATVSVLGNSIVDSGGLGIDLGDDGVTPNDIGDGDSGENDLLNFPVITDVSESGGTVTVDFDLDVPAGDYRIELFDNPSGVDPTGFGEAETLVKALTVTHTGSGYESFQTSFAGSGVTLTATATEDLGGGSYGATSEVSAAATGTVAVNSTGDGADINPGDGACDTGGTNAEGERECTLRAAIAEANAVPLVDTIDFAIPAADPNHSSGVWTISPSTELTAIATDLTIDGYTQTGASANTLATGSDAVLAIELDGAATTSARGVRVNAGAATVRGLVVNSFWKGIEVEGGSATIVGNWLGLEPDGATAAPNERGVEIRSSASTIGGSSPADRNVSSGNTHSGVYLTGVSATGNVVIGNYLGTDAAGTAAVANLRGVYLHAGPSANTVGGSGAGDGNVISGNTTGVQARSVSASGNTIAGNVIGLDAPETSSLANGTGIWLDDSVSGYVIGGTGAGEGNVISGNTGVGVALYGPGQPTGNAILGNSIVGNGDLGIDLSALTTGVDGVTVNDAGDGDTGANDLLNHPEIVNVQRVAGELVVDLSLDVPAGDYRIELFANSAADASGYGEGETPLGGTTVTHTGSGGESFTVSVTSAATMLTATATEDLGAGSYGSTSELSAAVPSPDLVIVNSTGDGVDAAAGDGQCDTGGTNSEGDPECTLRAAIVEANDPATPVDAIWLTIPASDPGHSAGVWTIAPGSSLPAVSDATTIAGSPQTGWAANTVAAPGGLDGTQAVVLDGSGAGASSGLVLSGDGIVVSGLVVGGFASHGIEISGDGVTVTDVWIGTDVAGTGADANGGDGIHVTGPNATVGGTDPADRVLVAGNSGDGIEISGAGAAGATVIGTIVGLDAAASAALANGGAGVVVDGASGARIGGTLTAEANVISSNGADGVVVSGAAAEAAVLGNRMAGNGDLAIDLVGGTEDGYGVTANDSGDGDTGPNGLLNRPVLSTASVDGGVVTVTYTLDAPAGTYRIELFANPAGADPSGHGEAGTPIGTDTIVHPGGGPVLASVPVPGGVGTVVTATATVDLGGGSYGATSEVSNAVVGVDEAALTVLDEAARRSDVVAGGGLDPSAASTTGAAGQALSFDGVDDRLVGPGLDVASGELTVGAWVRADTLTGVDRVVSKRTGAGVPIYELSVDGATGEAVATLGVGGGVTVRGGTVGTGAWHQLLVTWDGTDLVLYVDGAEVDRVAAVGLLSTDTDTVAVVGTTDGATDGFDGRIDQVVVAHGAHSGDRVAIDWAAVVDGAALVSVGGEQTGAPGSWTVSGAQTRSGSFSLAAPDTPAGTGAAWAVASGIDEVGLSMRSWWWLSTASGIDLAGGTRAGPVPTDEMEAALTSPSGWELRRRSGATEVTDAAAAGSPSTGAWVEVEIQTDQDGESRILIGGVEVTGWTAQGGDPASGSAALRTGLLPVGENWYVDDPIARRLVTPEPVTSLGSLDRQ